MEIKHFNLTDGLMELNDDRLLIWDKAKQDRNLMLLTVLSYMFLGLGFFSAWFKNKGLFLPILGLILLALSIPLLIKWYKEFKKIDKEIPLTEVKKVKFSTLKFERTAIAKIITKDMRIRRIKLKPKDCQELQDSLIVHKIFVEDNGS
jgi:hypothetical protein